MGYGGIIIYLRTETLSNRQRQHLNHGNYTSVNQCFSIIKEWMTFVSTSLRFEHYVNLKISLMVTWVLCSTKANYQCALQMDLKWSFSINIRFHYIFQLLEAKLLYNDIDVTDSLPHWRFTFFYHISVVLGSI